MVRSPSHTLLKDINDERQERGEGGKGEGREGRGGEGRSGEKKKRVTSLLELSVPRGFT